MKRTVILFILIPLIIIFCFLFQSCMRDPVQHITTDIEDYGSYDKNYDDEFVNEFITSFFPAKIEECFENVKYEYRTQDDSVYAFEAYLEFTISDKSKYEAFVDKYTGGIKGSVFPYDTNYIEYIISDYIDPNAWFNTGIEESETGPMSFSYAMIGKILCSSIDNRIIFVAIGARDARSLTTDFFNIYFKRFGIDPWEYARTRTEFAIPPQG